MNPSSFVRIHYAVFVLLPLIFVPGIALADLSLSLSSNVHLQSDTMEYLKDQGLVVAKGKVHVQQGSVHLYADQIRYDLTAQDIFAEGNVVWQDENEEIEAKTLTYNLRTKEGKAYNIKTSAPPFVSTGEEIDIKSGKIVIKNAILTTCDYAPEYRHYHMKVDKITIYSGDYLVAENVVLFIGKVPVFYFPFFVKTIHDLKTPFSVSTGATDYLGNYILLTTNYILDPKRYSNNYASYGALYTDYFFKKGFGLGVSHELALNDFSTLSLYGYGIQEKDSQLFRWEGRARGLWAISSSLQGRVEADVPGDGNFGQHYSVAQRDPSLVSTTREFDISTTYSARQFTLGVLLRRTELADVTNPNINTVDPSNPVTIYPNYLLSTQMLPQFNFSLFPQNLIGKNWLKYDLTLQGDRTYNQAQSQMGYISHLSGEFGISQSLLLLQSHTLTSRVAFDDKFQDKSDAAGITIGPNSAGETRVWNANNSWDGRWTEFLRTNLSYTFSQKLNNRVLPPPGSLSTAGYDLPNGVTTNNLTGLLNVTAGSVFSSLTSTSYNIIAQVGRDAEKFDYISETITSAPSTIVDTFATAHYSIAAKGLKDINFGLNLRSPRDMWRFRTSVSYVDPNFTNTGPVTSVTSTGALTTSLPPSVSLTGEVDLAFFTNYRLSLLETYDLTNSQYTTRNISIYRDLHDWQAQLSYSEDPIGGKRVFFTLNLKAFPGRPLTVSDDQLQRMNQLRNQGLTGAASQFQ
ncbi:MAG TPA: LptA/OstA family protein [bacterium]|nr:LptA/OstA family protein [bacterium]